jgi:hypothetical protein
MSDEVSTALEHLSEQVSELRSQVRALDRPAALPSAPAEEMAIPPGAHAWLGSLDAPVRRRPQLPRVLLEGLFLAAAAAAAAIAELDAVAIAGVMVGAWVLVALIEWAASRADREPPIPVYSTSLPESRPADPAWFAPPVEHTLLDGSTGDPDTAVTRLPPMPAEDDLEATSAVDLASTAAGEDLASTSGGEDPEATVEQRPSV